MSCAGLPTVPGYDGPFPLRVFLKKYFNVDARYGSAPPPPSPLLRLQDATDMTSSVLFLDGSPTFAVSVYAVSGVQPPRACPSSPRLPPWYRVNPQPLPSLPSLSPSHGNSASSPGYTDTHRRVTDTILHHPLFHRLMTGLGPAATGFLSACCALVVQFEPLDGGLQVMGPVLCETTAGVVDATALRRRHFHANVACGLRMRGQEVKDEGKKRSRSAFTGACSTPLSSSSSPYGLPSPSSPPAATRARREDTTSNVCGGSPSLSSLALLGRTIVPRKALMGNSSDGRARLLPALRSPSSASHSVPPSTLTPLPLLDPLPERWLERLWLQQHPASRDRHAASLLPPALRRRVRKHLPRHCSRDSSNHQWELRTEAVPPSIEDTETLPTMVTDDMLRTIFPFTLITQQQQIPKGQGSTGTLLTNGAAEEVQSSSFLFDHLRKVIASLMEQCSRLDLRGFALKHTAYIETRFALYERQQQQPQRQQRANKDTSDVHPQHINGVRAVEVADMQAPVDVLVSYLCDTLRSLQWTSAPTSTKTTASTAVGSADASNSCSFWGMDTAAAEKVLDALSVTLRGWLTSGPSGQGFPLSAFLTNVPVARIPWLNVLYTTRTPAKATTVDARQRRSMRQQCTFLQLIFFLTQEVIPFCLQRAFHVTTATRGGQELIFLPRAVWWRLLRRQTRGLTATRGDRRKRYHEERTKLEDNAGALPLSSSPTQVSAVEQQSVCDSTAPAQLSPVRCGRMLWARSLESADRAKKQRRPLLYAAIRFLPDRRRLRPIAIVRQAHPAKLAAIARGIPPNRLVAPQESSEPAVYALAAAWLRRRLHRCAPAHGKDAPIDLLDASPPPSQSLQPSSLRAPRPLPFFPAISRQQSTSKAAAAARRTRATAGSNNSPSSHLRDLLACLMHGLNERRRCGGQPTASPPASLPDPMPNGSHAREYGELRAFAETVRGLAQEDGCISAASDATANDDVRGADGENAKDEERLSAREGLTLAYVRGDGAQCYDRLSQKTVLTIAESFVRHEWYAPLEVEALRPCESGGRGGNGGFSAVLQRQRWRLWVSDADVAAGVVPAIPSKWIVRETVTGRNNTVIADGGTALHRSRVRGSPTGSMTATHHHSTTATAKRDADASSSASSAPPPWMMGRPGLLSGNTVRHSLGEHLQSHLVTIEGRLFLQRRGIVQGSPVAMLLCEAALLSVDAALAGILAEHHEPSLLLRRVDDVLVVTASPVAGQRCWAAMAAGWPEVGYVCQPSKLLHVTARLRGNRPERRHHCDLGTMQPEPAVTTEGSHRDSQRLCSRGLIPWCGLLLHPATFAVSVEWSRVSGALRSATAATIALITTMHRGSSGGLASCLASATWRLFFALRLRVPATALCRVLNGRARVLQTIYETCLVWARLVARTLAATVTEVWSPQTLRIHAHQRRRGTEERSRRARDGAAVRPAARGPASSAVLTAALRTPLRVCVGCLFWVVQQHRRFLERHGSTCEATLGDLNVGAATALLHALRRTRLPTERRLRSGPIDPLTGVAHETGAGSDGQQHACRDGSVLWRRLRHIMTGITASYVAGGRATTAARKMTVSSDSPRDVGGARKAQSLGTLAAAEALWPTGDVGSGCEAMGSLATAAWRATQDA